jgi:hypothetical protein
LLDSLTRATFRKAEFGFFGVMVLTNKHTPRFCGFIVLIMRRSFKLKVLRKAVALIFAGLDRRFLLIS